MKKKYFTKKPNQSSAAVSDRGVFFISHDQMGHQGKVKVQQRKLHRFDWPGMRKACERSVNACLSCLQVKEPRKMNSHSIQWKN